MLDLLCILETCHYYGAFWQHSFLCSIINAFLFIFTGCYSMCIQLDRSYNNDWDFQEHVWFTVLSTHCQIQWLFKFHCLFYTKGLFYLVQGLDWIEYKLYSMKIAVYLQLVQKWKAKILLNFITLVLYALWCCVCMG